MSHTQRNFLVVSAVLILLGGCGQSGVSQSDDSPSDIVSSETGGIGVIQENSKVQFHYTLTVDGEQVDSSLNGKPLTYIQGQGQIVTGLEEALVGLKTGDTKDVTVTPEKGYGQPDPDAIHTVSKQVFENPATIQVGDRVTGQSPNGQFQATVTEVESEEVTLDLNHPLAGKTLHFAIEIMDVQ